MGTKKFDRELYNVSDTLTKGVMGTWLEEEGYTSIDDKENYGVDISCEKNKTKYYFETEVKYGWKDKWPDTWKEVRIPYRKKKIIDKWIREGADGYLTFVIFRKDCKQAWFIDGHVVNVSEVRSINNRYVSDEKFYHINIDDATLKDMENGSSISNN
jgi:hypothetical protein|tara:strand:- start:20 stop:490 length:471 start_codon:yes stop_codon:yes gene_type:complete